MPFFLLLLLPRAIANIERIVGMYDQSPNFRADLTPFVWSYGSYINVGTQFDASLYVTINGYLTRL